MKVKLNKWVTWINPTMQRFQQFAYLYGRTLAVFSIIMLVTNDLAFAQGLKGSFTKLKELAVVLGNLIFIIAVIWGLVKTVAGFVNNSPNAVKNLIMLFAAVALWYGFNTLVEDVKTSMGDGGSGGFQGDQ